MPAYYGRISLEAHDAALGNLVTNVLHVEIDVLTDPPNWTSIAADVHAWLGPSWQALLSTHHTFDQVVVTDENYSGSTHGQGVFPVGTGGGRTITTADLDPAICMVASLKTAVAKRYARGHVFMPPAMTSSTMEEGGTFNTTNAYWTTAGAFMAAYKAGHTASSTGYSPIVFSRTRVAQNQSPYVFPVVNNPLGRKQHFLRSRSTSP